MEKIYYSPNLEEKVQIEDLYDDKKYLYFLEKVNKFRQLTPEAKEFLKYASMRFIKINFDKIADYYCTTENNEIKDVLEKLNLIIVDHGNNINKEYLKLMSNIDKVIKEQMFFVNSEKEEQEYKDDEEIVVNNNFIKQSNSKKIVSTSHTNMSSEEKNNLFRKRKVGKFDLDGTTCLKIYGSITEANLDNGLPPKNSGIGSACKKNSQYKNFIWKYLD